MAKYLYGSRVNQIQSLIFETSKLKEIIGASELVEQICTAKFEESFAPNAFQKEQRIQGAAGIITYLFEDLDECQQIVYDFHQKISTEIPGIQLTQALVKFDGALNENHLRQLEEKLSIQRTITQVPHGLGLMISERSRRTGGAAVQIVDKEERLDRKQACKRRYQERNKNTLLDKMFNTEDPIYKGSFALEIEDLMGGQEQGWVAIVHADGNGLGNLIRDSIKKITTSNGNLQDFLKQFSENLNKATELASKDAFREVIAPVFAQEKVINDADNKKTYLPIRPVLLGGDDLTVIIRGDLALPFTEAFLRGFERHTQSNLAALNPDLFSDGLTSCAGIAYIKPKYPFHYGVDLAETLCKHAKNQAKDLALGKPGKAPSALFFHRVLSSFVDKDFESLVERELYCKASEVGFDFGPYFLQEQANFESITQLRKWAFTIQKEKAPKAPLREWLTELEINNESAQQLLDRIKNINREFVKPLKLDAPYVLRNELNEKNQEVINKKTHLYDVITLASIEKN